MFEITFNNCKIIALVNETHLEWKLIGNYNTNIDADYVALYNESALNRGLIRLVKQVNYLESFIGENFKKYKVKDIKKLLTLN